MDITNTARDAGETAAALAAQLWDLITVDRDSHQRDAVIGDLEQRLVAGTGDDGVVTTDELEDLFDRLVERLPPAQDCDVDMVRSALADVRASAAPAPTTHIIREVVEKPVIQRVTEQRVVRVTERVQQNVTNVTNNTSTVNNTSNLSNTTVIHEGSTTIDNRVTTAITADGDVSFDQVVANDNVVTGRGGVAANGNLNGSAVNTGTNTGILAGDDVSVEDSIIGNGNTQVNDSDVGAFAGRGDATNVSGENVNTGSGDLVTVEARGDVQAVTGNANKLSGDADVSFDRSDGPVNVAVGEGISQQAAEDNSSAIDTSSTVQQDLDASVTQTERIEDNSRTSVDLAQDGDGNQAALAIGDAGPVGEALAAESPMPDESSTSALFASEHELGPDESMPSDHSTLDDDDLPD